MGEKIRNSIANLSARLAHSQVMVLLVPGNLQSTAAVQVQSFDATVKADINPC